MVAKLDGTSGLLQQYDYQVPTTGFSYTFAAGTTVLVMNPAGTLATGTVTMPAAPADGMTITFSSTQTITALTVAGNTGQSIVSAPTTLPAGQSASFMYRLSSTSWLPITYVPQLISSSGLATAVQPIGVGQTWQVVTGSRALSTTYTNSTGRPIMMMLYGSRSTASTTTFFISLNGAASFIFCAGANSGGGSGDVSSLVLPAGTTYNVTSSDAAILGWYELR